MDNMLEHPWTELQVFIKEKWLTQKAFASILWKKVSEVNELLKWKRNITIQWDYLLHQYLWTPIKYWILKQIDYDYSLLYIEENEYQVSYSKQSEESSINNLDSLDSSISPHSSLNDNITQNENNLQDIPIQEQIKEDDEDFKKRAKIFKSF